MTIVKFQNRTYRIDDHHRLAILRSETGIRLLVNNRWWMPPKPFPPGFDRESAEFDTVESAVYAFQDVFRVRHFFWFDEEGNVVQVESPQAFIRHAKRDLGIVGPARRRSASPTG